MKFWKMHGAGNDFVLFDADAFPSPGDIGSPMSLAWGELAVILCDRHFGIGADGVQFAGKSDIADIRYYYYNSDGSRGEMCGNGIRCFAKYVYERGILKKDRFTVETDDGVRQLSLNVSADGLVHEASAGMGSGSDIRLNEGLTVDGRGFLYSAMLMGVPHMTIFGPLPDIAALERIGPMIERHPDFPRKTNVNFAQITGDNEITMLTWERGAGHTLACGTGACASVVIGVLDGRCEHAASVLLPYGKLDVLWQADGEVVMTGPAVKTAEGSFVNY